MTMLTLDTTTNYHRELCFDIPMIGPLHFAKKLGAMQCAAHSTTICSLVRILVPKFSLALLVVQGKDATAFERLKLS